MVPIVLSAPAFFGAVFLFGMLAAGLGLIFGLLTPVALVGAVWLSPNKLLMGSGAGGVHHSLNTLILVIEIGLLWARAWRPYSLDALLLRRGAAGSWRRATVVQGS